MRGNRSKIEIPTLKFAMRVVSVMHRRKTEKPHTLVAPSEWWVPGYGTVIGHRVIPSLRLRTATVYGTWSSCHPLSSGSVLLRYVLRPLVGSLQLAVTIPDSPPTTECTYRPPTSSICSRHSECRGSAAGDAACQT
jgi:hypothetical protein